MAHKILTGAKVSGDLELDAAIVDVNQSAGAAGQLLSSTGDAIEWINNYAPQIMHEVKLGAALSVGTPVYVSSADGTNMIVSAASNTSEATSSKTLGLLVSGGALNDHVFVVTEGLLEGLDTSLATAGDPVWLGANGTILFGLANKPDSPAHLVFIGIVTRAQQNNGEIFVKVQNGFELDELHDVLITNKANNEIISYDATSGLWKNKTIADTLGYTPYDASNPAGYISSYTETDPIYTASSWYTTINNSVNWDTAYSWGNHASAGYLTSYTETDTLQSVTSRGSSTTTGATFGGSVGIGVTPTANSKLHVYRAGGSYDTIVADGDIGTNTGFAIYEGGSPRYAIYSNGYGGDDSFNIYNFGAAANSFTISTVGDAFFGGAGTFSSSVTASQFITDGSQFWGYTLKGRSSDNYGAFGFYSNDGGTRYGYIQSHSANGGQLNITADGGGQIIADSRGLLLQPSSGNVGIGTSPSAKLHIYTGANGDIQKWEGLGYTTFLGMDGTGTYIYQNSSSRNFSIGSASSRNQLVLTPDGNVGIGTTSPDGLTSGAYSLSLGGANTSTSGGLFHQINGVYKGYQFVNLSDGFVHNTIGLDHTWMVNASVKMKLLTSGQLRLNAYGGGSISGTPTYYLAVDSSGYVIEAAGSGGGASVTNNTNNYVLTATGGSDINGESNLIFDGTSLLVTNSSEFGMIRGYADNYHGMIFRGYPTNALTLDTTAADVMSFFEYGGDFRFYQKNASGTLRQIMGVTPTEWWTSTYPGYKMRISGGDVIDVMNGTSASTLYLNYQGAVGATVNIAASRHIFYNNGVAVFSGSAQAPIFYDSDNTGYYVDPASTSILSNVRLSNSGILQIGLDDNQDRTNGVSATRMTLAPPSHTGGEWEFRTYDDPSNAYLRIGYGTTTTLQVRHDGDTNLWGSLSVNGGNIDLPTDGKRVTFGNTSVWVGRESGNSVDLTLSSADDINFYTGWMRMYYSGSEYSRIAYNQMYHTGSISAPIYYDYNDTNYWLDLANGGAKIWRNSNYNGGFSVHDNGGVLSLRITTNNHAQPWQLQFTNNALDDATWTKYFWVDYPSGGNTYSATSFNAPIFYDSNNTSYYVDPTGNTNLAGTVYASAYRGNANVAGTGEATYHPAGIYSTGNNWLYGTTYKNNTSTSGQGWLYMDGNYGYSVVGAYASTRYQGVWAMGDSYKLPVDGTSTGSLYGLAWSHPNAGGVASNLNTHGLLAMENGTFLAAISGSIRSRDDMRSPIFYDSNNTGYYCDPAGTSNLNGLTVANTINGTIAWSNVSSKPNWMTSSSLIATHSDANSWQNSGFYENAGGGTNWPSSTWYNSINVRHSNQSNYHGFQIAMSYYDNNLWFRSYQGSGTFQSWAYAISSQNIGSQSVNYASSANSATYSTYATYINTDSYNMKLHWSGQSGQPTWLWGSNNGSDAYVWNPSNFSVAYASSAGNADTVDGYHASSFLIQGGSWYGVNLPGSRYAGLSVNGGEIVFGRDLPNNGQMGILVDGAYLAGENNGFWSLPSNNDWNGRRGMYFDGTYLNFTTNSPTAVFDGYVRINGNRGIMGNYDTDGTASKCIWTIGQSWPLANMYGIGYEYGSGYDHHLALRNNGTTYTRIGFASGMYLSGNLVMTGELTSQYFYDYNDTNYYCNPAGSSRFYGFQNDSNSYFARYAFNNTYGGTAKIIAFQYSGIEKGYIQISSTSTFYSTSSDYRLKENVTPLTDGIERLMQLKPSKFNFIGDDKVVDGFLAHEAQEVVPEAVGGVKDGVLEDGTPDYQGIDQSKLVPLLTAALQEAVEKITALEARISALENI